MQGYDACRNHSRGHVVRPLLRSPAFVRDLRSWLKRRPKDKAAIEAALEELSTDANSPSLRTHKLHGPWAGYWACSAGYDLRVVFEFVEHEGSEVIFLLGLGTHDELY